MKDSKISLFAAILMNMNIMLGAGIFVAPANMAKISTTLSFLGWPLVGLVFFPVVFSFAQVAKHFTGKGSIYDTIKNTLNPGISFIGSWLYFLGYSSVVALQVIALREILVHQINLTVIADHPILFNIVLLAFLAILNTLSMSVISKIQNSITLLKMLPLFFVILIIFFYWNPQFTLDYNKLDMVKYAIPFALFGFWGFESSCNISHMIKGGKDAAAKAVLSAFFIVVAIYTLFHISLLHIMGAQNLANYGAPAFVDFLNLKNPILLNLLNGIISSAIVILYVSSTFGVVLSNSSHLHSMANENKLPFSGKIKKTSKRNRPVIAIWLLILTSFLFATLIPTVTILNSIINIGVLTSFVLTIFTLILIQKKKNLIGQLAISITALVSCFGIIYYSWLMMGINTSTRLLYASPLLILAISGYVMFRFKGRRG
jgi:amino acid transporter